MRYIVNINLFNLNFFYHPMIMTELNDYNKKLEREDGLTGKNI